MPYVEVWVDEADAIEDISDERLLDEIRKRNLPDGADTCQAKEDLTAIFYAFYFGKESEAINVMRKYVQDVTGKVLP